MRERYIRTVSYTHLDVYKRQIFHYAPGESAAYLAAEIMSCLISFLQLILLQSVVAVSYTHLVYAAPTEETALNELELFKDKWDSKYPKIYKSWNDNWATLSLIHIYFQKK